MPNPRKIVFVNDYYYHVFNRGVERRVTFTDKKEYNRALKTLTFYRYSNLPLKFSKLLTVNREKRERILAKITTHEKIVEIIAFCLMPNHFHFLLKQRVNGGISKFIADFSNSYARYFNTKNERVGPLFQGIFKAVLVETDEQLIHLTRYIHLNPVVASIVEDKNLSKYVWSSYREYLNLDPNVVCNMDIVRSSFSSPKKYEQFILDHIQYAKELNKIKHLTLE